MGLQRKDTDNNYLWGMRITLQNHTPRLRTCADTVIDGGVVRLGGHAWQCRRNSASPNFNNLIHASVGKGE